MTLTVPATLSELPREVLPREVMDKAVATLRDGNLVAFPTETVYGLGGDARNDDALRKIFALKGRPADHPLILHLASVAELSQWVAEVSPTAQALAEAFWPGPLTLVLPRHPRVSLVLTGGQDSIAGGIPKHPVAQALLKAFGSGLAAPSANRYGHVSPTSAAHVRDEFGDAVLILDGGDSEIGVESTIVSLLGDQPRVLRPGSILAEDMERVLNQPVIAAQTDAIRAAPSSLPRVPGSTLQHYAPRTPVSLVTRAALTAEIDIANAKGQPVAVLARHDPEFPSLGACGASPPFVRAWIKAPADAAGFAHELYARLRELDKLNAARILIECVPDGSHWDAVRDRLQRAAAGR